MAIYSEAMDLGLGVPTPIHAQTEAAELAREAVRRDGWQRRLEREAAALVVDHGRPHIEPWPGEVVPRNARALIETAKAKGWRVNLIEQPDRCTVEGVRGFEGFQSRCGFADVLSGFQPCFGFLAQRSSAHADGDESGFVRNCEVFNRPDVGVQ